MTQRRQLFCFPLRQSAGLLSPGWLVAAVSGIERKLLDTARRGLESHFSDLLSVSAYIVFTTEAGIEMKGWGLTAPMLAGMYRGSIGSRWRGHGPACLINDESILAYRHGHFGDAIDLITSVAVHEFAHRLIGPELFRVVGEEQSTRFAEAMPEVVDNPVQPANSHTAEFLRIMLHLAERLRRRGLYVSGNWLTPWEQENPSGPQQYINALGDELEQMESLPLAAVLQSPIPSEFTELFENDRAYVGSAD